MIIPATTAIAPWFGSNRSLADNVGRALAGCTWTAVPFAGGMCELLYLSARTIIVSDLHSHVLNLAAVAADPGTNLLLRERLAGLPHHPDALEAAQRRCRERERAQDEAWFGEDRKAHADLDWAVDYFTSAWMSRNGNAGTAGEFDAPLSVRWDAGGGDSAGRFRSATDALAAWQEIMRRCTFLRLDVFAMLARVQDREGHGIYLDPPFPDAGDPYKFGFDEAMHAKLAEKLVSLEQCRVVCRFYDHELIRRLYPPGGKHWHWEFFEGRRQTNEAGREVLLTKRKGV